MFAVVLGNPFASMVVLGPFESSDHANEWAETEVRRETWWVVELLSVGRKFWSPGRGAPPVPPPAEPAQYVGIKGDPFRDGVKIYGPFLSAAGANEWAASNRAYVVELLEP